MVRKVTVCFSEAEFAALTQASDKLGTLNAVQARRVIVNWLRTHHKESLRLHKGLERQRERVGS